MASLDYRRMKTQLQTGHGQDTPGIPPLVRLHLGFWYTAVNNDVSTTKRTRRDGQPVLNPIIDKYTRVVRKKGK